jgi:D-sedoheptulose 7-phosphate isomerase
MTDDRAEVILRVREHLGSSRAILELFLEDAANLASIAAAAEALAGALLGGGKILCCGNGGSMCDAMHFAAELTGRFRGDRRPLAALALGDPAALSAIGNDFGYEEAFARHVEALGRPPDALVALSTSGRSPNVLRAAEAAREANLRVVALTGRGGGRLAELADIEIRAPWSLTADHAQEIHIQALHALVVAIEHLLGVSSPRPGAPSLGTTR